MSSTTRRGRKRKLEKELDKIVLQDSGQNKGFLDAEVDNSSEPRSQVTTLHVESDRPQQEGRLGMNMMWSCSTGLFCI